MVEMKFWRAVVDMGWAGGGLFCFCMNEEQRLWLWFRLVLGLVEV